MSAVDRVRGEHAPQRGGFRRGVVDAAGHHRHGVGGNAERDDGVAREVSFPRQPQSLAAQLHLQLRDGTRTEHDLRRPPLLEQVDRLEPAIHPRAGEDDDEVAALQRIAGAEEAAGERQEEQDRGERRP